MKTEIEAKFYPVDKNEIRKKLKSIGAELITPERMMRRIVFDQLNNPEIKATYIRVRDESNFIRLSAKIHARKDGKVDDQKEVDVTVSNYEDMVEILKIIGLKTSTFAETLRETWYLGQTEIVIDTWPSLEPWIEIEAISEGELKRVAELLGQQWENKRITSCVEIYAEVYKIDEKEVLAKLKHATFDNPPF